ncbi:MAG TPA: YicC/YloC family endoribonuclease [Desulfuromonadales bacterium]|nr:YicC/YloC family endoribonuclease [Desulfuromonadales bacterium]
MIKSMTGYGKGQGNGEEISLTVEIKSVNHRYGDVTVKAPRFLLPLESEIKKKISARLKRGKIDVFINQDLTSCAAAQPTLNRPLAAAYVALFSEMREAFGLEGEIPLSLLSAQKDVVILKEGALAEDEVRRCLEQGLAQALDVLETMRLAEGEATCRDLEARLSLLEEKVARIGERAPQVAGEWQERLLERLARLNQDLVHDPQRVAQEVALFADRCDISEEITRFRSHLCQFRGLLEAAEPVGRQFDFLVQELNRETNTMGSKSNDVELTREVVAIKAELEKIREQVQNIE